MEWDTGAAQIILEEAGGKVCRFSDHQPLDYNKEDLTNPSFIAYARLKE
jgi:3'(2'), 5'-bisphosphate nucleotidase